MSATKDSRVKGQDPEEHPELTPLMHSKAAGKVLLQSHHQDSDILEKDETGRYPHLDLVRIACVAFVAIDHGNPTFGIWNVLFTQNWVLQYLFLVCGVCFAMSEKTLGDYCARLAIYFFLGVAVNLIAWISTGQDWQSNFFSVVFQFWFLVGVMMSCVLLEPMKRFCKHTREHLHMEPNTAQAPDERSHRDTLLKFILVIIGGPLFIAMLFLCAAAPTAALLAPALSRLTISLGHGSEFWGLSSDPQECVAILTSLCMYFSTTCCSIFIVFMYPRFFKDVSVVGWLVIVNVYVHRCLFFRGADERPFHFIDLTMISVVCYWFGLKCRKQLSDMFARYWFVVIFGMALLWPPGGYGRYDENPPHDDLLRIRYNVLECAFLAVFFIGLQRMVDPKIFSEDRLTFMNDWALIVFLVHKAVHIMCVRPLNWVILIALAPGCWLYRREK